MDLTFGHRASYAGVPQAHPEIPLEIAHIDHIGRLTGYPLEVTVLVDTGADITLLDVDFATPLGIDLAAANPFILRGVAGDVQAYETTVMARLCGAWQEIPVSFAPGVEQNLLGRDGALDVMSVAFLHNSRWLLGELV